MRDKILELFTLHEKLKFHQFGKALNIRSNKVAYHLKSLIKEGIIDKKGDSYMLAEPAEHLIPYISEKKTVIPVVLVCIKKSNKVFLSKRTKRPFLGLFSLPGGRLVLGESIEEAAKRIMKTKYNVTIGLEKILSISLEHVKRKDKIIHSFLLILVSAKALSPLKIIEIKNKNKIVASDYQLIKNIYPRNAEIPTLTSYV
ncbi:NUDIX domain-containing protein [Candidatus Pacearchaeota archaeon]|nr:NUDIX domain-containing protein [Candidatus Pacearchaeota archaeon]